MKQFGTVTQYIESQPAATQKALHELRSCILKAAPQAIEMFNYNIPAYALVEGGKRDQQVMMAGYKKHVGLYPHPAVIEQFITELKDYKTGRGSVQFSLDRPLPKELIVKMVKYRVKMLQKSSK